MDALPATHKNPTETEQLIVDNSGLIFPHQRDIFRKLVNMATAFRRENWQALPVLPRWHVLLIAPTGTGKSHLARTLAKHLDWPLLTLWATRWIIAGGRGQETWIEIARWLAFRKGKCIILLDELDKIQGEDSWSRHLRTEVFQLLDRELPDEIAIDDSDSELSKEALWARAQKVLRCDTLIFAAGAFQSLWDHQPNLLGFGRENSQPNMPTQREMKTVLPPELVNRFGQILTLPPLGRQDYAAMARHTAAALPAELREKFLHFSEKMLGHAIENGAGARFVEECITATLLDDSTEKPRQKLVVSRRRSISP